MIWIRRRMFVVRTDRGLALAALPDEGRARMLAMDADLVVTFGDLLVDECLIPEPRDADPVDIPPRCR